MAQNISTYINTGFTLLPSASCNVDVRLSDISDMRVQLIQTYAATSSLTGVNAVLFAGMGGKDPAENPQTPIPYVLSNPTSQNNSTVPVFGQNSESLNAGSGIVQPTPSQGTPQTTRTVFFLASPVIEWSNWMRITIYNRDTVNSCVIGLLADI